MCGRVYRALATNPDFYEVLESFQWILVANEDWFIWYYALHITTIDRIWAPASASIS